MPKVLISDNLAPRAAELLKERGFDVHFEPGLSPEALQAAIADADGLLVRSATKVTADVLGAAGRLKAIGRAGTGVDNIDLVAAKARGVTVMNTPGGNANAVVEHTLGMMIAIGRHIAVADRSMAEGRWDKKTYKGTELKGKTLAIFGMGHIGRSLATVAGALGMDVLAYDPFVDAERIAATGARKVDLDQAFAQADILTVHLPLTAETKHLVNAERLATCKEGVWVLNVARGGIVDEQALLAGLQSGRVGGAGLDCFETEPPPADHPLRDHPRVVVTPHLGGSTAEAQENVAIAAAEQVADVIEGKPARNVV